MLLFQLLAVRKKLPETLRRKKYVSDFSRCFVNKKIIAARKFPLKMCSGTPRDRTGQAGKDSKGRTARIF
jgi:hypothetical protein